MATTNTQKATDFRSYFDIDPSILYLATAGSGLMPTHIQDWRQTRDPQFLASGSLLRDEMPVFWKTVKQDVANFFHSAVENTFLLPNFSFGFNTLLAGLPKTHRFLLLDEDYPSVNFPVLSRGFQSHLVRITADLETDIIAAIRSFKPTVFVFSMVQYISGIKIAPTFIRTLRAEFPNLLLIADATQYAGTEPFDFSTSGLDAFGGSGYKWLVSGHGNGYLMLSDRLSQQLYVEAQAYGTPKEAFLSGKSMLAMYFEPGHQDTLPLGSLQQGISFLHDIGMDRIQQHLAALSSKAKQAFIEKGLLQPSVVKRTAAHSTIFNLSLSQAEYAKLQAKGLYATWRGTGVRVSFHLYNSEADLERLLESI